MSIMKGVSIAAVLVGFVVASPAADAHALSTGAGLMSGFAHPLLGIDHLAAMIAIGLWASQFRGAALWLIPMSSLAGVLAGASLCFAGMSMPMLEPGIFLSLLLIGGLVGLELRPGLRVSLILIAIASAWHGAAHAVDFGIAPHLAIFTAGFMISTATLHLIGIGIGTALALAPGRRMIGAAVVATAAILSIG